MKTLTAELYDKFIENAPANLDELSDVLTHMIDDNFVILDDADTQNYIQATPDDNGDGFLVEVRYYANDTDDTDDENDFVHYRKIVENIDQVFNYFELFFNDVPINTDDWQNITQEFSSHLYLKSNINNTPFDYYIFHNDDTHEHIMLDIGKMTSAKDSLMIALSDNENSPMLNIRLAGLDYQVVYQDGNQSITKTINYHTLNTMIADFINGGVCFIN